MNTLKGNPTTERPLPLISAAAAAGAECFCIDAGWYDDRGLADWWPTAITTFLFPIADKAAKVEGIMKPAMDAVLSGKKPASSFTTPTKKSTPSSRRPGPLTAH